ncbi:MAG: hypothetical protein JW955_10060 [Sedimentisphaerales bacterium]|nr:hypothetical protein [Sedimentisphaerales bacterium]
MLATIAIPVSQWFWPAGVLLVAALALMVWSYTRAARSQISHVQSRIPMTVAFTLKWLGILALASCLIEPLWSGRRAKSGANLFVVLADNSGGMNVRDRDTSRSRAEILRDLLNVGEATDLAATASERPGWLSIMADDFQIRPYLFDSRLRRTVDFSDLTFDGKATDLGSALQTLAARFGGMPVGGILLLTDGCATDLGDEIADLPDLPPVYPVVIGEGRPPEDIAVAGVSVSQTPFEDAPVTIQADVEATGFAGRTVAVDLLEESGTLVERQPWKIDRKEERQVFRFRLRLDRTGVLFYRVRATGTLTGGSPTNAETSSEATLVNNERTVVVDRGKGPYRILYVAGRPNWEFKFLKRAVEEDEQVQLVGLIRVAKREPRYDWRGNTGETSNPLYRGFDEEDQKEAEQYDEPVLVRLNIRDRAELNNGIPRTREELFDYHAIILDDVEAEFFPRDQMDLIHRFVAERGGGLLMLGGKESFRQGDFRRTPIGNLLPVYLEPSASQSAIAPVRLQLTREGWLQPWARLRDNEEAERQRLSEMPDFRVFNRTGSAKPGARVIQAIDDAETPRSAALVVQRLGNGRTAALTVGDVWRWGMQKPPMREDMDKFWRQTLRWLVADTPGRISFQVAQKPNEMDQVVTLQVRVRDKNFEPVDNASITIQVREPSGQQVRLTAAPAPTESGLFEATYVPRASGAYLAQASVTDAAGTKTGDAQIGWASDLEAREFQSVKVNRPLLEKIARRTGGRIVEIDGLEDFARGLPRQEVPVMDSWVRPLWDLPGVLPAACLFVLTCFLLEWALRRWKGMP